MALYGSFALNKHFSELDEAYDDGQGTVLTPAQRRATAIANLYGAADVGNGAIITPSTQDVQEYSNGVDHTTKITLTAFAIGTIVESSSLAFGAKVYTLPAGSILVEEAVWSGYLVSTGTTKTDTPEFGIGTVIASGAAATLTTGTWENVMDGGATVAGLGDGLALPPDINSTVFSKVSLSTVKPVIKVSGGLSHDLYINVADAWTTTTNGDLSATGVLILKWKKIN